MPLVLIEKRTRQITVVTLNRPERRNALTIELLTELTGAINVVSDEPNERIIILRGAGAAFCTGMDLKAATSQNAHAMAELVAKTLLTLSQTRLLTIAAVQGAAVAGGAGIMSACDFVVAAEETKRLIEELWWRPVREDVDLALKSHIKARDSSEAREGIAAFNEKRRPKW